MASPIPRGALEKWKCEGTVRAGLLQVGLQSFLQRGLAPNEIPPPPKSPPKAPQNPQNDSPNDRKSSKMRCWGASWATLGAFGRAFVPKRVTLGGFGGDLGHPRGPCRGHLGPKWHQIGTKVVPKWSQEAPKRGDFRAQEDLQRVFLGELFEKV